MPLRRLPSLLRGRWSNFTTGDPAYTEFGMCNCLAHGLHERHPCLRPQTNLGMNQLIQLLGLTLFQNATVGLCFLYFVLCAFILSVSAPA